MRTKRLIPANTAELMLLHDFIMERKAKILDRDDMQQWKEIQSLVGSALEDLFEVCNDINKVKPLILSLLRLVPNHISESIFYENVLSDIEPYIQNPVYVDTMHSEWYFTNEAGEVTHKLMM